MDIVSTKGAPGAIGPYVQGVLAGGFVFVSGQIGLDPERGVLVEGGTGAETARALANVRAILEAAGSGLTRVVRATVYLADLRDFEVMNSIYAEAFGAHRPTRVCVEVARLPKGARVEIDAVAVAGG
jgi:2-iminobutanoate/2-iminopropanoate deaminase